jgi:hypothetical protein
MHSIKALSLVVLFAAGALAGGPTPPRPAPTPIQLINQTNVCGNNVEPYCCNSEEGGTVTCAAIGEIRLRFLDAFHVAL